jgi:hypothetical protein
MLVPAAIAGALAVLAFAGGFGRLATLGQAFSGPAIPGTPRAQVSGPIGATATHALQAVGGTVDQILHHLP